MPIKSLNKSKLAYGLSWYPLTTENEKSESQSLAKSEGKKLGCLYSSPSGEARQLGLASGSNMAGAYPAAALFAQIVEDGIIIESFGQNKHWLCLATGGEVIIGYDVISSPEEVKRKITDFFDTQVSITELPDHFRIVSDEQSVDLLRDCLGEDPELSTLFELLEQTDGDFPKAYSSLRVKPLTGNRLYVVIGVAAALGASVYMVQHQGGEESQPKEIDMGGLASLTQPAKKQNKVQELSIPTKSAEEKLAEAIDIAKREEMEWLNKEYSQQSAHQIINSISNKAEMLPLIKNGWRLVSLTYSDDPISGSYSNWVSEYGTPLDIKTAYGDRVEIDLTGRSAKVGLEVSGNGETFSVSDVIRQSGKLSGLPQLMTSLISSGHLWELSEIDSGARREVSKEVAQVKPELAAKRLLDHKMVSLRVTGNSLSSLRQLGDILKGSPVVIAKSVTIELNGKSAWIFRGIYHEL